LTLANVTITGGDATGTDPAVPVTGGAVRAAGVTLLVPVTAVFWGVVLLHESLSLPIVIGMAVILAGTVLTNLRQPASPQPAVAGKPSWSAPPIRATIAAPAATIASVIGRPTIVAGLVLLELYGPGSPFGELDLVFNSGLGR